MTRHWRVSRFEIATERTKYRQNLRPDGDCATQSRVSGEATARIADRRKCSEKGNSGPDSVSRSSSWCNCISTALYDPASAAVEPLSRFDPTPVGTHVSSGSATGSRTTTRLRGPVPRAECSGAWIAPIPCALLAHGQGHAPQTPHTSVVHLSAFAIAWRA